MGTALGVLFIAAAAVIGVGVGLRPTVIDGRRVAAEIEKQLGAAVACDREIRLGVDGAAFECTIERGGAPERLRLVMDRDGNYAPAADPGGWD